ncbi:MAG: multicopper oxidase domain-containing protein [Nanoarchaeota archaeon]|nr:multicopper oxidase domain-containing protein [Nanoarchaeota archaeon]
MNKLLIGLIIALIVGTGLFAFFYKSSADMTGKTVFEEDNVKVFEVDSANLKFYINGVENPDMKVKMGDMVRVNFKSSEGYHDWVLEGYNVSTVKINPGNTASVGFVADKKGTFSYYCSVGKHRQNGMEGNFIVE